MLKVVLDTNIIISGVLYRGNSFEVLKMIEEEKVLAFSTLEILNEVFDVLKRDKFSRRIDSLKIKYDDLFGKIVKLLKIIKTTENVILKKSELCRDKDDNKFIKCAILSGSNFLISGDTDLLIMKSIRNIKIVTAAEFFTEYKNIKS
jgi:uncharacterized protein